MPVISLYFLNKNSSIDLHIPVIQVFGPTPNDQHRPVHQPRMTKGNERKKEEREKEH